MQFLPRWVEIGHYARQHEAEEDALALAAVGIGSRIIADESGIALAVAELDALRARDELLQYHCENSARAASPLQASREGLNGALAYAALLLFFHGAAGRYLLGFDWWTAGYAQAGLIVTGEWWRTITALSLHADIAHLAGNIVAGGVFGIAVAQFLGPGLAWFAILISAGIANELNALAHPASHTAVGASTAVFAALGLASVLSWRRKAVSARGMRGILPVAAGVALLADLGTGGERTDLGAHVLGFMVGLAVGAGLLIVEPRIPKLARAQLAYGAGALSMLVIAWALALANS
jgi:membrane associated rhomboid family serine protease